jgi:hypothetical protein
VIAHPFEHHGLQIVVQNDSRGPSKGGQGFVSLHEEGTT